METATRETGALPSQEHQHLRQLTPLLVWAVVFADIGTSVYYVPGLLYQQGERVAPGLGNVAPLFVGAALLGFVLLAWKYVELCWRQPEGGGVVTIASSAISPSWGALGGILISIDYFLTAAISTVAGLEYLGSVFEFFSEHVVLLSIATLALLALVNVIGIRESAMLSLCMAGAALLVDALVIGSVLLQATPEHWQAIRDNLTRVDALDTKTFLIGFGGAWLAFSGLESISQLSPAMKLPIRATASRGMTIVVVTVLLTTPVLTLFSVSLLPPEIKSTESERFISELAFVGGGMPIKIAVVASASALLFFAANTAIIGSYHVFLALAERHYMPSAIASRNRRFKTPANAVLVATIVPMLVIAMTAGELEALGAMYAFGLLGAFMLSSLSLDMVRWREKKRGTVFWIGVFTTLLVYVAWMVNLFVKKDATIFGTLAVLLGMGLAIGTHQKWFTDLLYQFPTVKRLTEGRIASSEQEIESIEKLEILSLAQAETVAQIYPSGTLVAMRAFAPQLVTEAIARERGRGGSTIYAVFVEERTGLFVRAAGSEIDPEANRAMSAAAKLAEREGFTLLPIWTVSYNAVEGIVRAAEALHVGAVMIGVSQRGAVYHLLRGHVVNGLTKRLPSSVRLLLIG